jgi:hypothetical protein
MESLTSGLYWDPKSDDDGPEKLDIFQDALPGVVDQYKPFNIFGSI